MCMPIIIAVRCLFQSLIVQEHISSSLPSLFHPPPFLPSSSLLFPFTFSTPLRLVRFPTSLPFHSTLPSFPTPPFIPISPFPPISSSIIFPFFPFDPSFPSSPSSRLTPYFFPIPPLIQPLLFSTPLVFPTTLFLHISLFHPISPFHPTPPFLPTPPFVLIPPSHHTPLSLPIPPSLPPLFFFISFLSLFAIFPSPASFLFSFFPSSLCFPPVLPFLPPIISYPISIPSYPSFTCLFPSFHLLQLFVTSAFILTLPLLPLPFPSLPPSPFHYLGLITPSAFLSPLSFALLHSLSPC